MMLNDQMIVMSDAVAIAVNIFKHVTISRPHNINLLFKT